jgi:uncharacterized membrane-anchored protein YitT (DUF2179 family)
MTKLRLPIETRRLIIFLVQALVIVACEIANGLAFQALIVPAKLLSGGVVGTALLLNQLFSLPIGLQTAIYNIPIFILGWRYLGRRFTVLSLIGVGSFSFFVDNLHPPILTNDLLLVAIFGGVATGIADGIIMRAGGSTGGFDILGLIVSRRFNLSTGQVFLVFNGLIIGLGALFNKPEYAMYTLIMLFVSTRTIDAFLTRSPRPVALIVSTKDQEIAAKLLHDLDRGVTYLEGGGAYTDTQKRVLMCVITRYELNDVQRIVKECDPHAFTIILNASDVIGKFDRGSPLQSIFG